MKCLITICAASGLSGCQVMQQVTCAPRYMVEACLQEAWAESNATGLGPQCFALNEWAKAEHWAAGGTETHFPPAERAPHTPVPQFEEKQPGGH